MLLKSTIMIKEKLGINKIDRYTSFKHVTGQNSLNELHQVYQNKTDQKIPLTPLTKHSVVSEQLNMISELVRELPMIYPVEKNNYTNWTPAVELEQINDAEAQKAHQAFQKMLHGNYHGVQKDLDDAVNDLKR